MAEQTISQDKHDGMAQIFKVFEVYLKGGGMTEEQFEYEKQHYLSMPVKEKTQSEVERFDVASKAAQIREVKKATGAVVDDLKYIEEAIPRIQSLGLKFN